MTKYDPRKNAEGYNDPTPYAAEKHMMAQIRGKQARVAGGYFENIISASCDYYLSRGLAKIEKTPEPMKPLGAKNRKGQFLACYTKQAQPDYERIKGIDRTLIDKPSETAATDLAADVEFLVETYEPRVQLSDSDLKALTAQAGDFELRASIDNIT